jgi:hypothetical protein
MPMPSAVLYLAGFIERFSDDQALLACADRTMVIINRALLPEYAQPGDFVVQIDEAGHFRVDREITEMRQLDIRRMNDGFFG